MIDDLQLITNDFETIPAQLREWRVHWPQMGVLILLPEAEQSRLPALQVIFREHHTPMVGALFPALVTDNGFVTQGAWLLRFNTMPPWFLLTGLTADKPLEAEQIAAALRTALDERDPLWTRYTLFMIFDGMLPNIETILTRLYQKLTYPLDYAGVNAGRETFQPMHCLFDSESVIGHGLLGLLLPSEPCIVVRHGYPVSKTLMRATSTVGNRIDRIDGQPAFEVYRHVIQSEYGVTVTRDNFYEYAVHFPFGLVTMIDVLVRIPVAFTDDGSLCCIGEVPPHSMLRLLQAPTLQESDCIEKMAHALGALDGKTRSQPLLTFYCAGRRMHFGSDAARELANLKGLTGASTMAGALSLGEMDSLREMALPRFHNAAIVCIR
jgi:hypothetical protein